MNSAAHDVLVRWVNQALSRIGRLPVGEDPAVWVADQFAEWLQRECGIQFDDCESWLREIERDIQSRGGWNAPDSKLDTVLHAIESLDDLRSTLRISATKSSKTAK